MAIEHVNRKGDRYFLQAGKPRKSQPNFYFARKLTGAPVEAVPDGYEIFEDPERGQVYLRKIKPSRILPGERSLLEDELRRAGVKYFRVVIEGDSLIVYVTDAQSSASDRVLHELVGSRSQAWDTLRDMVTSHAALEKMLRFDLIDEDRRLFAAARWCFLGSIDRWMPLMSRGALPELARSLVPHVNQESFFELI